MFCIFLFQLSPECDTMLSVTDVMSEIVRVKPSDCSWTDDRWAGQPTERLSVYLSLRPAGWLASFGERCLFSLRYLYSRDHNSESSSRNPSRARLFPTTNLSQTKTTTDVDCPKLGNNRKRRNETGIARALARSSGFTAGAFMTTLLGNPRNH